MFDGISVAQQALKEIGFDLEYYASEVDKHAIEITQKNHPNTIQKGDVKSLGGSSTYWDHDFDLLIGGSPCQDLSVAGKKKGLGGKKSVLFWEYVRILNEVKPKYFILENVASMSKEAKETITRTLGVYPIMINASLVSAQSRKRLFWTNIPNVVQPQDRNIFLKDIIHENTDHKDVTDFVVLDKDGIKEKLKSNTIRTGGRGSGINDKHNWDTIRIGHMGKGGQAERVFSIDGKSTCLSSGGGLGSKTGMYVIQNCVRKLTPIECERLQSLPDGYTEGVSKTQRYVTLGNAFNKEVIKHILSFAQF